MGSKRCYDCGETKALEEFHKDSSRSDGYAYRCKECRAIYVKDCLADPVKNAKRKQQHDSWAFTKHGKKMLAQSQAKYRENNPLKEEARKDVAIALREGLIVKGSCEVCRTNENIEAHHCDYNTSLDVMWLCKQHHSEWHRNNTAIGG